MFADFCLVCALVLSRVGKAEQGKADQDDAETEKLLEEQELVTTSKADVDGVPSSRRDQPV